MKTATALSLIAAGAILTFAITAEPPFLNLRVVGVVLMVVGVAGMAIPQRGYGWLRRRMVIRRGPAGPVTRMDETRYPPYITINPGLASSPEEALAQEGSGGRPQGEGPLEAGEAPLGAGPGRGGAPAEETVEEYLEE